MILHEKDLMLDFYAPIKATGRGRSTDYYMSIAMKNNNGRIVFLTKFIKEFNDPQRLSVKFTEEAIYLIVDVPTDRGLPFYKLGVTNNSVKQLGNKDLVTQIFNYYKLSNNKRAYFTIELKTTFDGLNFYTLKLCEVITLNK